MSSRPSRPGVAQPRTPEPIHMVVQKGPNYVEKSHNPAGTAKVVSQIISQIQPQAQPAAQVQPSAQVPAQKQ